MPLLKKAQAHVTNLNYDDAVRLAFSEAKANGWYGTRYFHGDYEEYLDG